LVTITYDDKKVTLKKIVATLKSADMAPEGKPVIVK